MQKYIVTEKRAVVSAGHIVMLADAQAKTRMQNLITLRKGRYEVLHPIEFKRGEIIEFEKEIEDKGLLITLEPLVKKAVNDAGNPDSLPSSAPAA